MMLDYRDILSIETELQQVKDIILNKFVTWRDVADKTLTTDGDFEDGTDTDTVIQASIEPIVGGNTEVRREIQGLAEDSSHVLLALKNYNIKEGDLIVTNGFPYTFPIKFDGDGNYRINYVVPDQYNIDYTIYLLKIDN